MRPSWHNLQKTKNIKTKDIIAKLKCNAKKGVDSKKTTFLKTLSYLNENANNILLLFNKKYSSVLGGLYGRNGVLWISDDEVSDALELSLNA